MLWNQINSETKIRYCDLGIDVNNLFDIESAKYDASIYGFVKIFISDTSFGKSYYDYTTVSESHNQLMH